MTGYNYLSGRNEPRGLARQQLGRQQRNILHPNTKFSRKFTNTTKNTLILGKPSSTTTFPKFYYSLFVCLKASVISWKSLKKWNWVAINYFLLLSHQQGLNIYVTITSSFRWKWPRSCVPTQCSPPARQSQEKLNEVIGINKKSLARLSSKDVFRQNVFGDESCSSITMRLAMCLLKGFIINTIKEIMHFLFFYFIAFKKNYT